MAKKLPEQGGELQDSLFNFEPHIHNQAEGVTLFGEVMYTH